MSELIIDDNKIQYAYFDGLEAQQYAFYMIPQILIIGDYDLSYGAILLYSIMLNRMTLTIRNNDFRDKDGHIFIIYTMEEMMKDLKASNKTIVGFSKELESAGLIVKKRQGLGKPNLLYVKNFTKRIESNIEKTALNQSEIQKCKNYTSRNVDSTLQEVNELHSINNNIINTDLNNKNDKLINDKSRDSRACEDESSMSFKNGELIDEENEEKNNTMPTHRKTPTKYPSNDTSYEARHEMREMVSERGLDPFTYQHMHHLVQKLYYDKIFTPEECLALSDKLNELDKEHWYMTVAKAFSYSLDKSKSKKIKSRVGYLLKIIEKNVEQIEYNESGEPERKADELRKTFENIKNGKLATSS